MGSGQRRLRDVYRVPDAGGNDFRADVMDGKNVRNRFDEMDSLFADVIQSAYERTDKNRARPGGH